jgi:Tfp pilus assembly protein PilN
MRAVNLIPVDSRRASGFSGGAQLPVYGLLGLLAVALAFVTVYVLTSNSIADRKAKLSNIQAQVSQAQAQASRLGSYAQFQQLAQTRAETVREIAAARFDWHGALADLSKVVPANTSLQSLVATVVPGATAAGVAGNAGSGASNVRGGVPAPAFELTGCTGSQDDVARLMSRLRVINGVTRVTLGQSQKTEGLQAGAAVSAGSAAAGCGPNKPTFDLVVFFKAVPGAGPTGVTSVSTQSGSSGTQSGSSTATSGKPVSTTTPSSGGAK